MKFHMPFTFEGWVRLKQLGQAACLQNRWSMQERMIPMPKPGTPDFEEAKVLLLQATGLEMVGWVIFARPPRNTQVLHSDCAVGQAEERALCALNVPVCGGPGSRMEWYDDRSMQMVRDAYGDASAPKTARYFVPTSPLPKEELPLETAYFDEEPLLVNTYLPHRVVSANNRRAVVSIRFAGNPSFEAVRNLLSNSPR